MNQPPENNDTEAIRSDIDSTRKRMDSTIDALEQRFKGRHLVDEVLGFLRPKADGDGAGVGDMTGKIKDSAGTAARAAFNTVRTNPVPTLLIGAGIAWMIYQSRRSTSESASEPGGGSDDEYDEVSSSDLGYDIPETAYPSQPEFYGKDLSGNTNTPSAKPSDAKGALVEKIADLKQRVEQASSKIGGQAKRTANVVRERAGEMYVSSRDGVVSTIAKHPLEVAAGCLVAGLAVGLLLPTADKVDEMVGPTTDRLKRRAREAGQDFAQRGRRVVQAATTAIREEVEAQGLTPDALRHKAEAVAGRAKEAVSESAEKEGIIPSSDAKSGDTAKNEPGSSVPSTPSM